MHPNPAFRKTPEEQAAAFARERAFGTLAVNGSAGPVMAHVPFLMGRDASYVDLHLVRSNPVTQNLPSPAVIAVQGPDAYISPDWYEVEGQVPTWNYIAVHLRGRLELRPAEDLYDLLERQSTFFEKRLAPKPVWTMDKMDKEALDRMMRMIVPARFYIEKIDSTWKLGQNKTAAARNAAAKHLSDTGGTAFSKQLSMMMAAC